MLLKEQRQPSIAGHATLFKQSTGLFENSPYAELLRMVSFAPAGTIPLASALAPHLSLRFNSPKVGLLI